MTTVFASSFFAHPITVMTRRYERTPMPKEKREK